MLTQRRLIPHLPLMSRANHSNQVWSLKHPTLVVKKARATKVVSPPTDDRTPKLLSKYPKRFTRKAQINSNDSHQLYLVNDETATKIAQHLTKSVGLSKTFVETNPGEGKLTKLLVESGMTDLRLLEAFPEFIPSLQETYAQVHPNRVKLKHFDMVTLRRSIYLDRVTGGSRCADVLSELPFTEWEADDTNFAMYAATGSNTFYWHLIYSLVLQNSLLTRGRCELYMVSPSQTYMSLTSSNRSALSDYRALSILFQIFFEYQLLDKFPREHFVPSITNTRRKIIEMSDRIMRNVRGPQSTTIDPDSMYFVKIVPRRDLYDWCPPQQIQELWHFIVMHFYSRQNRIIPLLEKLIPGIGARLILNFCTKQPERPQRTYKVDVIEAPPTTNPSMTISDHDYYENLNIYTHFGDLQPMQLFTLFQEFRRMPEFSSGVFLSTMERELQRKLVIKSELGDSISALRVKQTSGVDSKVDEKSVVK